MLKHINFTEVEMVACKKRMKEEGYRTFSEYIRSLIRWDLTEQLQEKEHNRVMKIVEKTKKMKFATRHDRFKKFQELRGY